MGLAPGVGGCKPRFRRESTSRIAMGRAVGDGGEGIYLLYLWGGWVGGPGLFMYGCGEVMELLERGEGGVPAKQANERGGG